MNIRQIYYSLPIGARYWVRKVAYGPTSLLSKKEEYNGIRLPNKGDIYTGGGDFLETGLRFLEYFKKYGGLQPQHSVLDIGSGIGRMAIPLTGYLNRSGKYLGFDAVPKGVNWCAKHISTKFENFNFIHAAVKNDLYTDTGTSAEKYVFPCETDSIDLAISISVFTHMEEVEVQHYMNETAKGLSKNGRLFATFFIYDSDEEATKGDFVFPVFRLGRYRLMNESVVSANVAFAKTTLIQIAGNAGLRIIDHHKGSWKNKVDKCLDFQDIILFEKI